MSFSEFGVKWSTCLNILMFIELCAGEHLSLVLWDLVRFQQLNATRPSFFEQQ